MPRDSQYSRHHNYGRPERPDRRPTLKPASVNDSQMISQARSFQNKPPATEIMMELMSKLVDNQKALTDAFTLLVNCSCEEGEHKEEAKAVSAVDDYDLTVASPVHPAPSHLFEPVPSNPPQNREWFSPTVPTEFALFQGVLPQSKTCKKSSEVADKQCNKTSEKPQISPELEGLLEERRTEDLRARFQSKRIRSSEEQYNPSLFSTQPDDIFRLAKEGSLSTAENFLRSVRSAVDSEVRSPKSDAAQQGDDDVQDIPDLIDINLDEVPLLEDTDN